MGHGHIQVISLCSTQMFCLFSTVRFACEIIHAYIFFFVNLKVLFFPSWQFIWEGCGRHTQQLTVEAKRRMGRREGKEGGGRRGEKERSGGEGGEPVLTGFLLLCRQPSTLSSHPLRSHTLRLGLLPSLNPLWIPPDRCAQRCALLISRGLLWTIKSTVKIRHHRYAE